MKANRVNPAVAVVLAASCALPGCATSGSPVLGRTVTLVPAERGAPKAKGELLAVQDGRVWLRTKDGAVRDFAAASLREVQVQRHGLGEGYTRRLALIGGLVSTVSLTAACSSVEGNSGGGCLAVGAVVGGLLVVTGLLSSAALDSSARLHAAPQNESLRAYARFPAGLPREIPPEWLTLPPEKAPARVE